MFDDISTETNQPASQPEEKQSLQFPFPAVRQLFRVRSIEIESDLPIRVLDCQSVDQFHFIEKGISAGFKFRTLTEGNQIELEVKNPGENTTWRPLTEKFVSGIPSEKFPLLMRSYLTDRSNAIALELARQLAHTDDYSAIHLQNKRAVGDIPPISTTPEEIALGSLDSPFSILKRAQRLGIEISVDAEPEASPKGTGNYHLSIRHNNHLLPIGAPISLEANSIRDRDVALAQAVTTHIKAPPLVIEFKSQPERKPIILDATHCESVCQQVSLAHARSFNISKADADSPRLAKVSFLNGTDDKPVSIIVPYIDNKQFEKNLALALDYYFVRSARSTEPATILCGKAEVPCQVFAQLEPELHSLLSELSTLGYALIDNGGGRYTLKNCTTIFEIDKGLQVETRVGELEKEFRCNASVEERGTTLRQLIEEYLKADKLKADSERLPRASELLTRRNILNTYKATIAKEDLFNAVQQGAALRLNFSDASEGQNRLGLYYRFADAFSQILIKYRQKGDPTPEQIRRVQLPAFDTVVELYCSQIPTKEAAGRTPEYFKIIFADSPVDKDHILIKLGMAATRLAIEERERARDRVIISPNCKILMLSQNSRMFDPLSFYRQLASLDINLVKGAEFKKRLENTSPLIRPNEMVIAPDYMKKETAAAFLKDFISQQQGETSVLYFLSHGSGAFVQTGFGVRSHVDSRFFEDVVAAAVAVQPARMELDLSHLTIICDGCMSGSFATHVYSHIAKAAQKLERSIAKEGMPVIIGSTRDKSLNWINFVREGQSVIAQSSLIGALTGAERSPNGITVADFLYAADNLTDDLHQKMNGWEYYHVAPDSHPVKRPLHAQVPIVPGSTVWSVADIIERLEDASKRTAHPLPPLPKPTGEKSGLLSIPRPIRISLNVQQNSSVSSPS